MAFAWPNGKRAALSLSFDDARASVIENGMAVLNRHGVAATFYVVPSAVEKRLEAWREAVKAGHEMGNHTVTHPCCKNYPWSRTNALEDYTLERMAAELDGASEKIRALLNVTPTTFAYPCGQTYVGRGEGVKSYVPLVAKRFVVGRAYLANLPFYPEFGDLAQSQSTGCDRKDWPFMKEQIDLALKTGGWLTFTGHDIADQSFKEPLTTYSDVLDQICKLAKDPASEIWVDTVANIGAYIKERVAK
jgi:peptidoglycan-N-acetylglucosamine deacetylase